MFSNKRFLEELRTNKLTDYKSFMRMDDEVYELLWMVTPIIEKEDTTMWQAISANEHLSVTLRYLATGNTFEIQRVLNFFLHMFPRCLWVLFLIFSKQCHTLRSFFYFGHHIPCS